MNPDPEEWMDALLFFNHVFFNEFENNFSDEDSNHYSENEDDINELKKSEYQIIWNDFLDSFQLN